MSAEAVSEFLVKHFGILPNYAEEMVKKHKKVVDRGIELRSYTYFIAEEVLVEEQKQYQAEELPDEYFDPNFEPEDD